MPARRTKIASLALPALFLLSPAANAQLLPVDTPPGSPTEPAIAPATAPDAQVGNGRIVFVSDRLDAGELLDTETGHVEYQFRNVGNGPLTISQIKPSCGCTVPELEQKVYQPDETGTIKVDFDPKGKRGNVLQSIRVFTDSKTSPMVNLTMRAMVKPIVVLEPNAVLNFMSVEKGQEVSRDIKVMGRFPEFEVTRATTNDPLNFDVEVIPGGEVEVDGDVLHEQIIRVTLKDTATPGQLRTELSIRTNEDRKSIFSMAAVARVLGDVQFSPARLTLGRLEVGDAFEREIRVTSRAGKPFEITGANLNNRTVQVRFVATPVDPETRTEWIIKVTGTVEQAAARFNTVVNVLTDVPGEEIVPLQLYGQLRPQR
ncbi:MAG: DUF1573 domain-containing protein [Planctomycetota bacterium]